MDKMEMPAADPASIFHAPDLVLDSRFVTNLGGNGSNMVSRSKYELISSTND